MESDPAMTSENGSSEEMGMEGGGMQPPSSSTRLRRSQWVDMSLEERKAYVTALMSGHGPFYFIPHFLNHAY